MLRTLQLYIFCEISKTFILTLAGLTAVLSMGGGVLNMIRLDEVSVEDLLHLMMLVLPVAATLTLPMATMYSAAATYGRLAADNELTACRGGGINLLHLLKPTVALAAVSAAITFGCLNFLIPSLVRNLDQIVVADIPTLLKKRLNQPGRSLPGLGRYRLYTDAFHLPPTEDGTMRLILTGVSFLEIGDEEVDRVGTAARVDFRIDRSGPTPKLSGEMWDTHYFDRQSNQFFSERRQTIKPLEVPISLPPRIKFLDLPELLHFRLHPTEWVEVKEQTAQFRVLAGRSLGVQRIMTLLSGDRVLSLDSSDGRYVVRITDSSGDVASRIAAHPDGSLTLTGVEVTEESAGERRVMTADRATLEITPGSRIEDCRVQIDLYGNVRVPDFGRAPTGAPAREAFRLKPVPLPPTVITTVNALTELELQNPQFASGLDPRLAKPHAALVAEIAATSRKITGVIHQRLTFSLSVFVLALLAAGLGIVFSQSQLLVSVGISMIPGALVLVTILMGKQLTENAGTETVGLGVMWGGLALVAALDAYVLLRRVRR